MTDVPGPLAGGDPSQSETAQARAAAMVGRTISDRYKIVELVAMGAMGAVYKGEHLLMRKQVAIKVLHPDIENFPELVARFEREAIAGAHVNHPNVASATDFGKFDGDSYFLVLEYIEGTTLSDVIKQGAVEPMRAVKILRQLAQALGAAHQKGIVHRDVKPRNIMICEPGILDTSVQGGEDEVVKLIDFGLAKVPVSKLSTVAQDPVADSRDLTNAGVVMGTVAYMAPETALGMGAVQARADLYAAGIIMYEMLAGVHPFEAVEPQKLFAAHCSLPVPPVGQRNPAAHVPPDLESILQRLLEKDPSNRYPDAESLVAAIDAFKMRVALHGTLTLKRPELPPRTSGQGEPTSSASGGLYIPKRAPSRGVLEGPRLYILIGVAVAAVVVIAIVALARAETSEPAGSAKPSSTSPATAAGTTDPPGPGVTAPGTPASSPASPGSAATTAASTETLDAAALTTLLGGTGAELADPGTRAKVAKSLEALAETDPNAVTPLFEATAKLGEPGFELLYAVSALSDTSKGALRARGLLDRPDVNNKLSPALKIAHELRKSNCQRRAFLSSTAATNGDARSLVQLQAMLPPKCTPGASPCCYAQHGDIEKAVAALKAKSAPAP